MQYQSGNHLDEHELHKDFSGALGTSVHGPICTVSHLRCGQVPDKADVEESLQFRHTQTVPEVRLR